VPPPPVAGAAVGTWLDVPDGLGVAEGLGVGDRLADGLPLALGELSLAVRPGEMVGVAEPLAAGENGVGSDEGEDPEQAETDAEANMAKVAQPTAVNRVLSPAPMMVVRIFMGPPHASGSWRTSFPVRASEERSRVGPVAARAAEGRSPEAPTAIKVKPVDGTDMKWPIHHWNIRLRD
jgi:hypothetical protein